MFLDSGEISKGKLQKMRSVLRLKGHMTRLVAYLEGQPSTTGATLSVEGAKLVQPPSPMYPLLVLQLLLRDSS